MTNETIEIKYDDLKYFDLAYFISYHCAQGSSLNFEYSIYEWNFFDKRMLYVAISRARKRSFFNFCDVDCEFREGFLNVITIQQTN
jgi:ATP-dependent exoDNAse (exonuclease V) alpha subunit